MPMDYANRARWHRSIVAKIFLVSFVCIHVPLIALLINFGTASQSDALTISLVVLGATLKDAHEGALAALWAGVLYDGAALAAAWDLVKDWDIADHERLRRDVTRLGLKAEVAGRSVRDVAVDMVHIAREGLKNRARFSGGMVDERGYLSELEDIADSGITPADRLLALYNGEWQGDLTRMYRDFAY